MGCEGPGRCCQANESAQRWLPHRKIRGERAKVAARRAKHAYHVAPTLLANCIRRPTMVPEDFLFTLCDRRHRHCQVTGIGPKRKSTRSSLRSCTTLSLARSILLWSLYAITPTGKDCALSLRWIPPF